VEGPHPPGISVSNERRILPSHANRKPHLLYTLAGMKPFTNRRPDRSPTCRHRACSVRQMCATREQKIGQSNNERERGYAKHHKRFGERADRSSQDESPTRKRRARYG
jgi:hypothetical protein